VKITHRSVEMSRFLDMQPEFLRSEKMRFPRRRAKFKRLFQPWHELG
jgi:hypothetical protein